jgi:hypothetical protein
MPPRPTLPISWMSAIASREVMPPGAGTPVPGA